MDLTNKNGLYSIHRPYYTYIFIYCLKLNLKHLKKYNKIKTTCYRAYSNNMDIISNNNKIKSQVFWGAYLQYAE